MFERLRDRARRLRDEKRFRDAIETLDDRTLRDIGFERSGRRRLTDLPPRGF